MKIDVEKSKIYSYTDQPNDLYTCGMLYTGKRGYFSDYPDFADCEEDILIGVNVIAEAELVYYPFKKGPGAIVADSFKYFCPEEYAVGTPEFRPYKTLDDLPFKIGDSVTFREKDENREFMLIFTGTMVNDSQLAFIHLGAYSYSPEFLLEDFEWFNGKKWVPFGIEVNE